MGAPRKSKAVPMFDVMVDLETLGTGAGAIVLSIGAVAFDPASQALNDKNLFDRSLDVNDQIQAGRTFEWGTFSWWLTQSDDARDHQANAQRERTVDVLREFSIWLRDVSGGQPEKVRLWGNGAAFDNTILADLYRSFGIPLPWMFWNDRCYRTLKAGSHVRADDHGTAHVAVDDAIKQAKHMLKMEGARRG